MKNLPKLSLLIAGLALTSVSQSFISSSAKTSKFNTPFEINLSEKVLLPKDKKELTVSLEKINDSRCPVNVQCMTAGNATAEIKLINSQGSEVTTKLVLGRSENEFKTSDTASVTLGEASYSVILSEINELYANKAVLIVKKGTI